MGFPSYVLNLTITLYIKQKARVKTADVISEWLVSCYEMHETRMLCALVTFLYYIHREAVTRETLAGYTRKFQIAG